LQTRHCLYYRDARWLDFLEDESIHLVVTSPPYPMIEMWDGTFFGLNPEIGEALENGHYQASFEMIHRELGRVWRELYRVLQPGGFACINIGDATRTIGGRFQLFPNHSRIIQAFRETGFDTLPAILWRKQTNAPNKFMGSGMLPAGAYVTLEHEYILIFRKGAKREFNTSAEKEKRRESALFWEERNRWFSDLWDFKGVRQDLASHYRYNRESNSNAGENHERLSLPCHGGNENDTGPGPTGACENYSSGNPPASPPGVISDLAGSRAPGSGSPEHSQARRGLYQGGGRQSSPGSTGDPRKRSGAYPYLLPYRLINMYSVYGDTVLDPFLGTGTTTLAALACGRNSVGCELDQNFASFLEEKLTDRGLPGELNRHHRERLHEHLRFVEEFTAEKGKPPGHINRVYGFPVVTKQETSLQVLPVRDISREREGSYIVLYGAPGELLSSGEERNALSEGENDAEGQGKEEGIDRNNSAICHQPQLFPLD